MRTLLLPVVLLTALPAAALAQTAVSTTPPPLYGAPPSETRAEPAPSAPAVPAALPMSEASVVQALNQRDGMYPPMARAMGGGQIQDTWTTSGPREGVQEYPLCEACVYKVRVREFMTTTLVLPPDAIIDAVDLGDAHTFQVAVRGKNMISVRPATWGVDTNLNVTTRSGKVYPFYLRAEGYNSQNTPDLIVRVLGTEIPPPITGLPVEVVDLTTGGNAVGNPGAPLPLAPPAAGTEPAKEPAKPISSLAPPPPAGKNGDFVKDVTFDPAKLHGWADYRLWGDDELRPETVFRDGQFTYIQFGARWDALELPTAYVVIDGIDELVNTRVAGTTFIVESVQPLISLKSGKKFLCLQYTGKDV